MNNISRNISTALIIHLLGSGSPVHADASADTKMAAILSTITEALVSAASSARDKYGDIKEPLNLTAEYSDRDWKVEGYGEIGGRRISISMTGYLWETEGHDLQLTYSGSGAAITAKDEREPWAISGRADWAYDRKQNDYLTMDFRHVMKFGNNSTWSWILGSEIVLGGALGVADGAVALAAAPATGGASVVVGLKTAISAAGGLVVGSNIIMTRYESENKKDAPKAPNRPAIPEMPGPLTTNNPMIYTVVNKDGKLSGIGPYGACVSGGYDHNGHYAKLSLTNCKPR